MEAEQQALRDKLIAATKRLPDIIISADTKLKISEVHVWSNKVHLHFQSRCWQPGCRTSSALTPS